MVPSEEVVKAVTEAANKIIAQERILCQAAVSSWFLVGFGLGMASVTLILLVHNKLI